MKKYCNLSLLLILFLVCAPFLQATESMAAPAVFKITRLQLYFANHRAETVIEKNSAALKAYADISFEGTGLLQGFWEVDGRILAMVNHHIGSEGATVTVETPDLPAIPTFESGAHRLRLVVTMPALAATLPEAIYFVAGEPIDSFPIKLLIPPPQAEIPYAATVFSWEGVEGSASYLITFFSAQEKPVFSAYTRDLDYKLPVSTLNNLFLSGHEYLWKVVSFGVEQNRMGTSKMSSFTFKNP